MKELEKGKISSKCAKKAVKTLPGLENKHEKSSKKHNTTISVTSSS